jgi:hypothetical protein
MLPGFNHNIRYKDRVFHVQTEDNGLNQPRLVTQVFIDGHVLALEKSNYQDILDQTKDPTERAGLVKTKMQDQHRRLLKNLVQGSYDDRITLYLAGPRSNPMGTAPIAAPEVEAKIAVSNKVLSAAEDLPSAPSEISEIEGSEPEPWRPLQPEDLIEIEEPIDDHADTLRPAVRKVSTPPRARTDDLEAPRPGPVSKPSHAPLFEAKPGAESEFLSVLDAEMERQLPWGNDEIMTSPPPLRLDSNPSGDSGVSVRPVSEPKAAPLPPPKATPNFKEARRSAKTVPPSASQPPMPAVPQPPPGVPLSPVFKPPPASDTLVDFGLPAALREQLAANLEARKRGDAKKPITETSRVTSADPRVARFRMTAPTGSPATPDQLPQVPDASEGAFHPAERQTLMDMELRRAAIDAQRFPPRTGPGAPTGGTDTLLEIDAQSLKREVAEQRAILRGQKDDATQTIDTQLPHTEHVPAQPLSDSKPPRSRGPSSGVRVTPVIQGEAVTPPPPADPDNPKSILVVERSLDEVILSYLSDEQE